MYVIKTQDQEVPAFIRKAAEEWRTKDNAEKKKAELFPYREIVGSLM